MEQASTPVATFGSATIEIRSAADVPMDGAKWALMLADALVASGVTGADGLASVSSSTGNATLFAWHPSRLPQHWSVDLGLARQTVAFDLGATVEGFVTVDGAAPKDPILLLVHPPEGSWQQPDVPAAVRELWKCFGASFQSPRVFTGDSGQFQFVGLAPGSQVKIDWSGHYHRRIDPSSDIAAPESRQGAMLYRELETEVPRADLKLDLETSPTITGTVVRVPTREPAAGVAVVVQVWGGRDTPDMCASTGTGEDGKFEVTCQVEAPKRLTVQVQDQAGGLDNELPFEFPPGIRSFDVGVLECSPVRLVRVRVQDSTSKPISEAKVSALRAAPPADDAHNFLVGPKDHRVDGNGEVEFGVPLDAVELLASASGFEDRVFPVPQGDHMAVVVLTASAVLEFKLQGPDPSWFGVRLEADEPLFLSKGRPSWTASSTGASDSSSTNADIGPGWATFSRSGDGRISISPMRHGVALRLFAVGGGGVVLQEIPIQPLRPKEHRVVELDLSDYKNVLLGTVMGTDGAPIPSADVDIGALGAKSLRGVPCDERGEFRAEGLGAAVQLRISAKGFAPLFVDHQPVSGEQAVVFVLDKGRSLRVRVVDESGRLAPKVHGHVARPGGAGTIGFLKLESPGVLVMAPAPTIALEAEVNAGGRPFQLSIPSGFADLEQTLVIPHWQELAVEVAGRSLWLTSDKKVYLNLSPTDSAQKAAQSRKIDADLVSFPLVFPGTYLLQAGQYIENSWVSLSEPQSVVVSKDAPAQCKIALPRP